jgi:YVTN family beta-propeller protein
MRIFIALFSVCAVAATPDLTPTGQKITPTAAPGSKFVALNPGLPDYPRFTAGQAISMVLSPDHKTLLALTSGYNRNNDEKGKMVRAASEEYVFVYSLDGGEPKQQQVIKIRNTFAGIAFSPDGLHFYVSGGVDDTVHAFAYQAGKGWVEPAAPIKLGHRSGLVLHRGAGTSIAGGLGISGDGKTIVVANLYNDSLSIVDATTLQVRGEVDLRPGHGVAGGEYPFWAVVKGNETAFVSSLRDREIVVVDLPGKPRVTARIKVEGNPNKMLLNRDQSLLFVACDNSDQVDVIDTKSHKVVESISTVGPENVVAKIRAYTGSAPNDLALSPDEKTLYVSNGGSNSVAVIRRNGPSRVLGLIPTGWYPNAVEVSGDGKMLYIANGKSIAGPNATSKVKVMNQGGTLPGPDERINAQNQYIYQLEKAGLLSLPVPDGRNLDRLTQTVAANNSYIGTVMEANAAMMRQLHQRIHHVIYIIKENRTYDQVLGDLGKGNGDPHLTEFGEAITPNFHKIARSFVDLDNFYDSGEVSGDGWPWSTSGRESDFGIKAVPLNYSSRGTQYEYEGPNRDINVGIPTTKERRKANPESPDDDDLLPGTANVAEPDGPLGSAQGKGYIWDAVLRAGLTFREYGCMSDTAIKVKLSREPFKEKVVLSVPANPELLKFGDPYFRGFDTSYPDFYREREWEREFDQYAASGKLPNFEIVQLQEDHMGDFGHAIDGVNTPERQQADNDYATARLIDKVAHSPFKYDTLIFILEDDAQDGPDHVDAHRSTAYVIGPYVKQGAVVSNYYTTVSMVRTMEDVLGLNHLNLNTATQQPMAAVFDLKQREWDFSAQPSAVLAKTKLPIPRAATAEVKEARDASYWAAKTAGFDFSGEDRVNAEQFNRVVWEGLKPGVPYPMR